jgi:hypothetical protein
VLALFFISRFLNTNLKFSLPFNVAKTTSHIEQTTVFTSTVGSTGTTYEGVTTSAKVCNEMEYVNTLIATSAVRTTPTDVPNKGDFITKGVDFTDNTPTIFIDITNGGAIVRDVELPSTNIVQVEIIFTTESGRKTSPIRGAPTSLPTNEFPTEKVVEIIINVIETSDGSAPKDVTLSVVACAESTTSVTSTGTTTAGEGITTRSHGTTATLPGSTISTTLGATGTTTQTFCQEMEYINTLIETDSVRSTPTDVLNKQDFVTKGVDFTDENPTIVIEIPSGGAVVRDVKVASSNIVEIEVIFTTESGHETSPVRGAPTSLPTDEFPTEQVSEIIIKVIKTSEDSAPEDVTLSVITCAEGTTSGTSEGKDRNRQVVNSEQ